MTGPDLIKALLEKAVCERDRVLLLLAVCLPHVPVSDAVIMTVERAEKALLEQPEDMLGRGEALLRLRTFATQQNLAPDSLLFVSQRQWPHPKPVPLSRIQAWRIVRRAITAVLSHNVDGSWRALRAAVEAAEAE